MTPETLGGRLPLADRADLNPAQREIFDRMATKIVPWANDAEFQSTAQDGRLIGPFNPALLNPAIAAPFLDLQFAEQMHTSLAVARKAGLSDDAARAVATGDLPTDLSYDETIALRLTKELSTSHRVDESLYRAAETSFGAKGLIDIAFLIGIYHSVYATLTMFAIPAPE